MSKATSVCKSLASKEFQKTGAMISKPFQVFILDKKVSDTLQKILF
jgi:hypothetical protein